VSRTGKWFLNAVSALKPTSPVTANSEGGSQD
jgi:hypothetical protein